MGYSYVYQWVYVMWNLPLKSKIFREQSWRHVFWKIWTLSVLCCDKNIMNPLSVAKFNLFNCNSNNFLVQIGGSPRNPT